MGVEPTPQCLTPRRRFRSSHAAIPRGLAEGRCERRVVFVASPTPTQVSFARQYRGQGADAENLQSKSLLSLGSLDSWQERVWQALRHLDDRSALNQSSLARLAYIQRLADGEYRGSILARGLALKETLIGCVDRIIEQGNKEPCLKKTREFLRLVKEGSHLTAIAEALGLSRERITRFRKKKAVDLVTQEFLRTAKTRKSA